MSESNLKVATEKMMRYCAYQERCEQEVLDKIQQYDLDSEEEFQLIQYLKNEKFLNEERYAQAFVRGKFNYNKWGKVKIVQALKQKGIPSDIISIGLEEINSQEYFQVLVELFNKKAKGLKAKDDYDRKAKLVRYLASKGFEQELIWSVIDK